MESIFYKYLISHGITNIIDVDGLLYAPLHELASFCSRFGVMCLVCAALVLVFWYIGGLIVDHYFPGNKN